MTKERKPGYYWAKRKEDLHNQICEYEEGAFYFPQDERAFWENELSFVSDQSVDDVIIGLKYKADTLSDMLADNEKRMKVMEEELKRVKDENRWISVQEKPLFKIIDENRFELTEHGVGEFLAMIPFIQRGISGQHDCKWIRHCVVENGSLCVVTDDDTMPSGWELSDVTHWRPLPSTEIMPPSETSTDLLNSEVEKTNNTISRLLKLKSKIKDLTIDDIGMELGDIIGEAVKSEVLSCEKEQYEALIYALDEGANQWKQEYNDCRKILQHLVDLKHIKDKDGKTDYYNEHQPKAWEVAKEFLKKYQHQ